MGGTILKIENLSVCYNIEKKEIEDINNIALTVSKNSISVASEETTPAVNNISFELESGNNLGIIGESGSGKTSIAMAIMGLLKKRAKVTGQIYYENNNLNMLPEKELNYYRWRKIAIVFQNSLDVLNPVLTVHEQIMECIIKHTRLNKHKAYIKTMELLKMVGLEASWSTCYPHQLSGGMRQRVLIAMALSCDPEILIVDEPTTALDAISKNEIIKLLYNLHIKNKFALIVISHDMHTITSLTSKIVVMYSGYIVEEGLTKEVLENPMHTYTRGLINASPAINPYRDLWGIPGEPCSSGTNRQCSFYNRCNQKIEICKTRIPQLEYISANRKVACNRGGIVTLLRGKGICKSFQLKNKTIKACVNCDIEIHSGEVVVLIGESGSGKTTLASILSGILSKDEGDVLFGEIEIRGNNATCRKNGIQVVFQDPFSATNEHLSIAKVVSEPLDILNIGTKQERLEKAKQALKDVQLPSDDIFIARKCYMLSGGQRQRVALARSLVMEPKLLIADEISSMLDPSTQANILRLLKGLQNEKGFAMLYITHDLDLARKIADRVYVMKEGRIIWHGTGIDVGR